MESIEFKINEEYNLDIDYNTLSNKKLLEYMQIIKNKHDTKKKEIAIILSKVDKEEEKLDELEKYYMKILEVFKERNILPNT